VRGSIPPLEPIEVATGIVFGLAEPPQPLPPSGSKPLDALERAIMPALERQPCLVSFSGGRDSSFVLAAATRLARREGLPLPVPTTLRFPGAADADESDWQEQVVAHLELPDWQRLDLAHELDPVGPLATRGLRRHGLLWPFNVHFHVPVLQAAAGGSVLTGIGGDEVFGTSRWHRANEVLARRTRPRPRDLAPLGLALAPLGLRRAVLLRRARRDAFGWLTAAGARAFASRWAAEEAGEPRGYARRLANWRSLRSTRLGFRSLELLAADAGVLLVHPIGDDRFLSAMAAAAPANGPQSRGALMAATLGDALPADVLQRETKASFDEPFWGPESSSLAARWAGEGADPDVVDAPALRQEWSRPVPDAHTYTLLQAAWLELVPSSEDLAAPPQPTT
jgi:asparagine synthase (glutamine-hydrolysing)